MGFREKGEFVLVVEGAAPEAGSMAEAEKVPHLLAEELPASQAAKLTGHKKSDRYALLNSHD